MSVSTRDLYEIAAQEDRSAVRSKLAIPAQLRQSGGRGFQTLVHDLSLSGFCASAIGRMHVGRICWLTIPGLEPQQSEVIWWENNLVGCAFENLLSPIVHDSIMARYQTVCAG